MPTIAAPNDYSRLGRRRAPERGWRAGWDFIVVRALTYRSMCLISVRHGR
jgi:hypothetical protein